MSRFIVKYPVITGIFLLMVLCSALSLYITLAERVKTIFVGILLAAGACILAPMLFGMMLIMAPVIWGALLGVAYAFRLLVT